MKNPLRFVFPEEFFTKPAFARAFVLGILYLGFAITQLFTFEDFAGVTTGYALPGGIAAATILAWVIPFAEVASLPYLISMRLPLRLRQLSKIAVIAVPVGWVLLGLWLSVNAAIHEVADPVNTGLFGATVPTSAGLWLIAFGGVLLWAAILVTRELPARK